MYGTLKYGDAQVRSGYIMVGLVKTMGPAQHTYGISKVRKLGSMRCPTNCPTLSRAPGRRAHRQ